MEFCFLKFEITKMQHGMLLFWKFEIDLGTTTNGGFQTQLSRLAILS
jgi:hypothetical protein